MALKLNDKWLWDFWSAQNGSDYHIFYLQSSNSWKYEWQRHFNVSVGHAVSKDLTHWTILEDALKPSDDIEAFDNYTTWTGSVIKHNNLWHMFYTGSMRQERGVIQRIGLATSTDLIHWQKHSQRPLLEADPSIYETLDFNRWHDQAWRDPWVFQTADGVFHMFITARLKDGSADEQGVIGHAVSKDLLQWQVCPPVTEPGEFGHMEVPQLVQIQGKYYLLFTVGHEQYSKARKARGVALQTGTHYLVADNPLGPFHYLTDHFLSGDREGSLYSGKLIQDVQKNWQFLAFKNVSQGQFIGELSNPMPVRVLTDGRLELAGKAS
jgi:beta-fructofuranosidase